MGGRDGGTKMYCPKCKVVTTCRAITVANVLNSNTGNQQRLYQADSDGNRISFFRRGRECLGCYQEFLTAELDEDFLDELIKLRDSLKSIKENAHLFSSKIDGAQDALKKLRDGLAELEALD
jgi:transcriptional regulator NrdR family protein